MRHIPVVGAPSSIGLRPHDETGTPQEVNRAPGTLRDLDVVERLDATDLGDVLPPPYKDFERPPGKARNEVGVATYSRSLADRIAACLDDDWLPVVIGGDCTIVLGCLPARVWPVATRVPTGAGSGSPMSTGTRTSRSQRNR